MNLPIKRHHLFEFEDLPWFPDRIRRGMTDFLRFFLEVMAIYKPVAPILTRMLLLQKQQVIVDLCAGGGGGMLGVTRSVCQQMPDRKLQVVLTDKFPNVEAFRYLTLQSPDNIRYVSRPVDAMNVPEKLCGVRTIFSAIHHFNSKGVSSIIADAVRRGQPIAIFDGGNQSVFFALLTLLVYPLLILVLMPFCRPFSWERLFFTYVVPLVPLCTLWDGTVSILRLYRPVELQQIARQVPGAGQYRWESGLLPHPLGFKITYLTGIPENPSSAAFIKS